eukprot:2328050-Rhodomonas_salina.1
MEVLCRERRKLRAPPASVLAGRVLACVFGREHKVPLVDAGSPGVLPHHRVDGAVGVDEGVVEPLGAVDPTDTQVLDQKRRHHHPHRLRHPARLVQLSHPSIDDRIPCSALLPGPQPCLVLAAPNPLRLVVVPSDAFVAHVREAVQVVVAQIPPVQTATEGLGRLIRKAGVPYRVQHCPRRQLPAAQIK